MLFGVIHAEYQGMNIGEKGIRSTLSFLLLKEIQNVAAALDTYHTTQICK